MRVAGLILALLCSTSCLAELIVEDAWSRATPPGAPMGAVYATFRNTSPEPLRVVAVTTSAARLAEIHESVEIGGMMRMREVTPFDLPARGSAALQPGGQHVMLMGLKDTLIEGESLTLKVATDDGQSISVAVPIGSMGQMHHPHHD